MQLFAVALVVALPVAASALLFLLACVGHLCIVLISHTKWYGSVLHKRIVDAIQIIHALLIFGCPLGLWLLIGFDPDVLVEPPVTIWKWAILAYLSLCWVAALIFLP